MNTNDYSGSLLLFQQVYLALHLSVNPHQTRGGRKQVTLSLTACCSEWNRARSVKPHCTVVAEN